MLYPYQRHHPLCHTHTAIDLSPHGPNVSWPVPRDDKRTHAALYRFSYRTRTTIYGERDRGGEFPYPFPRTPHSPHSFPRKRIAQDLDEHLNSGYETLAFSHNTTRMEIVEPKCAHIQIRIHQTRLFYPFAKDIYIYIQQLYSNGCAYVQ